MGRVIAEAEAPALAALLLAGLVREAKVAAALGVPIRELEAIYEGVGLSDPAMLPIEVDDRLNVYFADVGRSSFSASLFDDGLDGAGASTIRLRLAPDEILAATDGDAPTSPAGLILHVGRCGSTLLCNLLARTRDCVALKEPEFVNGILLRLARESDPAARDRLGHLVALLLRSLAHGVRRDDTGRDRACVVKLTSWNAMFAPEFVPRLEPVPVVVLTRDPWATVASFLDEPPYWYTPPAALFATRSSGSRRRLDAAGYFARVWSRTVERALALPWRRTLIVDYDDLVSDAAGVANRVRRHLGLPHDADPEALRAITASYSKGAADEPFDPRGRHRRTTLAGGVRELVTATTSDSWSALLDREAKTRTSMRAFGSGNGGGGI